MAHYIVDAAEEKKTFESKYGPLVEWSVVLRDDAELGRRVAITRKPGNDVKTGEELEGNIQRGPYGEKFVADRKASFAAGSGGGRSEDPTRSARILRQHSQDMAIKLLACQVIEMSEDWQLQLKDLIDWFDKDVIENGKP